MITGRRSAFEARCRERGYDIARASNAIMRDMGSIVVVDEHHPDYPRDRTKGYAGLELKKLLSRIGIKANPNCSCNARANAMDKNGIEWCEQNVETICDWLQEEAAKRKLPFVRLAGKAIINLAIRRAKKNISR